MMPPAGTARPIATDRSAVLPTRLHRPAAGGSITGMTTEPGIELSGDQAAELGGRVARALLRECGLGRAQSSRGWGAVLRAARAEGLEELMGLALDAGAVSPPGHIAAAIGQILGRAGRMRRLAAAAFREGGLAVLRELEAAGVRYAAIKGFATAPLYGRIHLRRIADVDLVIRPRDLSRAEEVLVRRGYRVEKRDAIEVSFEPLPLEKAGRSHGVAGRPGEAGRAFLPPIDLHVRLSYEGQFDLNIDEMLGRARRLGALRVLAPEDAVLVACSDAARDCFMLAGRSIADIAVLARISSLDWDAVVERARGWGLTAAAWIALSCAKRTLGARVPPGAIARLTPSPVRAAWLRLWLDPSRLSPWRLTRRGMKRSALRFAMAVLWPALVDGFGRRAAFVARYAASKLRGRLSARGGQVA